MHADVKTVVQQIHNQGALESESSAFSHLASGHILLQCNYGTHTTKEQVTHLATNKCTLPFFKIYG